MTALRPLWIPVLLLPVPALAETELAWDSENLIETRMLQYQYSGGEAYTDPKDGSNYAERRLKRLEGEPRLMDRVLQRDAKLKGTISAPPPEAKSGRVWLEDNYGRVLDEAKLEAPGFSFELTASRALKTGIYLKAELSDGAKSVWSGTEPIRMVPPPEDPWREYILGVYNMGTKPGTGELWRKLGLSHRAIQTNASPAFPLQNDLHYHASNILYSILGLYHRDHKNWRAIKERQQNSGDGPAAIARQQCLSAPETHEFMEIILTAAAQRFKPYPPLHYSIGDEIGIGNMAAPHDMCASPCCQKRYREWLKQRYGSLEALNKHWDTNYATFDAVEMMSNNQALGRAKSGNFAPWADRLEFMDEVLYSYIARGVEIIRKIDPDARCNISGVQQPSCWGFDHWRLAHTVDCVTPYEIGESPDVLASFYHDGKTGKIHAPGFGDDMEKLWLSFLRGYALSAQWDSFGKDTYSKLIDIEKNELTSFGEKIKTFADWVNAGPGRLRNRSERARDPVAILHSQPSLRANWILEVTGRPDVHNGGKEWALRDTWSVRQREKSFRVRVTWVQWLHDIGIWPKFIDARDLTEDGYLQKHGYKILIMPRVVALSDQAAAAIRSFVEGGGTVIADTWPGLMDETCKLREKGVLDDLFGVERDNYLDLNLKLLEPNEMGLELGGKKLCFVPFEKSLKAAGGQAAGHADGADVVVTRQAGKGRAVYLNFRLETYFLQRMHADLVRSARSFLLELLAEHGVKPAFAVTPKDAAQPFHDAGHDVCVYRNGRGWLVGVRPNPSVMNKGIGGVESRYTDDPNNVFLKDAPAVLRAPEGLYAYDIHAGKALGQTARVAFDSKQDAGHLYAFWPFEIQGLEAQAEAGEGRQLGIAGRVKTSAPIDGEKLVVHLKLLRPDGSEQAAYTRNLDCKGDAFACRFPLALNETGVWSVVLREPCSGAEWVQKVNLSGE